MTAPVGSASIAAYVEQSRRSKPASDQLAAMYRKLYSTLGERLPEGVAIPRLSVVYSTERRCEFVRVAGVGVILYDQYLGQSFNALNRILFATHSQSQLARGYACKYLAERLLTLGCWGLAQFFGLCFRDLDQAARAERNPFYQDARLDAVRLILTSAQELFVLAHELAHHLMQADTEAHLSAVGTKLREFVGASRVGPPSGPNLYYQGTLAGREAAYLPEFFADDAGAELAVGVATEVHGTPLWASGLAIRLAFRYLRLFRHLELLARRLAPLETIADPEAFTAALTSIDEDIWDGKEGQIAFFQLREHFLGHRLRHWAAERPPDKIDASTLIGREPFELMDHYDQVIEGPVVMTLVDSLKEHFASEAIADLRSKITDRRTAAKVVDGLTGWSMTTDTSKLMRLRRRMGRAR